MIILVDLNQVMIANMMMQLGAHKNAPVDESMLRHMVLNSLRSSYTKFKGQFGELVICSDDKNFWRREIFPAYKASRKKSREQSEIDWTSVFKSLEKIKVELKEYFPYRVIQIDTAEADDIIGTLVHEFGTLRLFGEPILILSGDKDYIQLHHYTNVTQYDPVRKRWIRHTDPVDYLKEHILKGDTGDGVPNILSQDNIFLEEGKKQRPVTKKRLEEWKDLNKLTGDLKRNYERNKSLIDLSEVPQHIKDQVMEAYEAEDGKDRSKLLNYFITHKLKHLIPLIGDF